MVSLFGIVYRGSRVIDAQRAELKDRIAQIQRVSSRKPDLRQKAQRASSRIAEMTEAYLRRIGADLHDGPAQLVGFAALKVEHARRARTAASAGCRADRRSTPRWPTPSGTSGTSRRD